MDMISYVVSFLSVANAGGFTQAARQSNLSKAKLSRHVKELEAELGIQLLYRTTRSFALTEQGKQFYNACQGLEDVYHNAVESLKRDFTLMQGTLKVTAPIDFAIRFLGPIIQAFCKKFPLMNVSLSLSNINEGLVEQQFDIAIRIADKLPDSNLRSQTVMEFKRLICASPAYIKKHPAPKDPQELTKHLCITHINYNSHTVKPSWSLQCKGKMINQALDHYIEVDSFYLQKELVLAGVGIGRIPSYYIDKELAAKKLIEIMPNVAKPSTFVHILYPDTMVLPHKTRMFIDFVKSYLKK